MCAAVSRAITCHLEVICAVRARRLAVRCVWANRGASRQTSVRERASRSPRRSASGLIQFGGCLHILQPRLQQECLGFELLGE